MSIIINLRNGFWVMRADMITMKEPAKSFCGRIWQPIQKIILMQKVVIIGSQALAEAAFMTGLERNADIVQMCSYAPLFAM
jgi:hypothetical protein